MNKSEFEDIKVSREFPPIRQLANPAEPVNGRDERVYAHR